MASSLPINSNRMWLSSVHPRLASETELQKILADEKMRSEQHKSNYQKLKLENSHTKNELGKLEDELRSTVEDSKLLQEKNKLTIQSLRSELAERTAELEAISTQVGTNERAKLIRSELELEFEGKYRTKLRDVEDQLNLLERQVDILQREKQFLVNELLSERGQSSHVLAEMEERHSAEMHALRQAVKSRQQVSGGDGETNEDRRRQEMTELSRTNRRLELALKSALSEAEEARANWRRATGDNEQRLRLSERQLGELRSEVSAVRVERDSVRQQLSALERQTVEKNRECAQLSGDVERLRTELSSSRSRLEEEVHRSKLLVSQSKLSGSQALSKAHEQRLQIETQLHELGTKLALSEQEQEQLRNAIADVERRAARDVQAARAEEWAVVNELHTEKTELEAKLQRQLDEAEKQKRSHAEQESTFSHEDKMEAAAAETDELERVRLNVTAAETELTHQRDENTRLRKELQTIRLDQQSFVGHEADLMAANQKLQVELSATKAKLEHSTQSRQLAERSVGERLVSQENSHEVERRRLVERVKELEDANGKLSDNVVRGERVLLKKKKAYGELLVRLKEKLDMNRVRLDEVTLERDALMRHVTPEEYERLRKLISRFREKHVAYQKVLEIPPKTLQIGEHSYSAYDVPDSTLPLELATDIPEHDCGLVDETATMTTTAQNEQKLELLAERIGNLDKKQKINLAEVDDIASRNVHRTD